MVILTLGNSQKSHGSDPMNKIDEDVLPCFYLTGVYVNVLFVIYGTH